MPEIQTVITPVVASGGPLVQGMKTTLTLSLPGFEIGPRTKLFLLPAPGIEGKKSGQPTPLTRVDAHTVTVELLALPTAPLGDSALEIVEKDRTVARGTVRVDPMLPVGDGLLEVFASDIPEVTAVQAFAFDGSGALWAADGNRLVRLDLATGTAEVMAGVGIFADPSGLAFVGSALYVADTGNHAIRRLQDGQVTTVAAAGFTAPRGLAAGPDGSLYVADSGSNSIRRVDAAGQVATVATGGTLVEPWGLAFGPDGTLYVTDLHRVQALTPGGSLRLLAGSAEPGFVDFDRAAARFFRPGALAWRGGWLLVADRGNGLLREVNVETETVRTLAGGGGAPTGPAHRARLSPTALAAGPGADEVVFWDEGARALRILRPRQETALHLLQPAGRVVAPNGKVFVMGRTNRPGARVRVAVTPEFPLNAGLELEADGAGLFCGYAVMTPGAENQVTVEIVEPPSLALAAAPAAMPAMESFAASSDGPQIRIDLDDCQEIKEETIKVKITLLGGIAAIAAVALSALGVTVAGTVEAGTKAIAFFFLRSIAAQLLRSVLRIVGARIRIPLPLIVRVQLQDGTVIQAVRIVLIDLDVLLLGSAPPAPPPAFANLTSGQAVDSNVIDVQVSAERGLVSGDVNGVPIGADGFARGVELPDAETTLTARVVDARGETTTQSLQVRLADGVAPRRLRLAGPLEVSAPSKGTLALSGPGLGEIAETVTVSTPAGPVALPVQRVDADNVQVKLPEGALNGAAILAGAGETAALTLDLRLPRKIGGPAAALLRDRVPAVGPPTGADRQSDEASITVLFRAGVTVGAANALLTAWRLRPTGAVVDPAGSGEAAGVQLWAGVPLARFQEALLALRAAPEVAEVRVEVVPDAASPKTASVPTATPGFDWAWERLAAPRGRAIDIAMASTWQLQYPRLPGTWNLKAAAGAQIDALIADVSEFSRHDDVPVQGVFRQPTDEERDRGLLYHGVAVASVYGARHNRRDNAVGLDGANPLTGGSRVAGAITAIPAAVYNRFVWPDLARFIDRNPTCRVVNCSFGFTFNRKKEDWYFNVNLADLGDLLDPFLPHVVDKVLSTLDPADRIDTSGNNLETIARLLECLREQAQMWASKPAFFFDLSIVLAQFATAATVGARTALAGRILTRLLASPIYDYVVASRDHRATLPQDSRWVKQQLDLYLPGFVASGLPEALVRRGAFLVNAGGNEDYWKAVTFGLPKRGTKDKKGQTAAFLWDGGGVPSAAYSSVPGYFREKVSIAARDRILLACALQTTLAGVRRWRQGNTNEGSCHADDAIYAPGADIAAAWKSSSYIILNGTSFAAPIVSGTIAYLLALDPNPNGETAQQQADRLHQALTGSLHSLAEDGRTLKVLDAFEAARRFLAYDAIAESRPENRFFLRRTCDVDDGTIHGNDTENDMAPGLPNAGADLELLPGDGRIDMSDLRSFRDAWLQVHHAGRYEDRPDYALRLRDLNATGAEPWTGTSPANWYWPRFDFLGTGEFGDTQTMALPSSFGPDTEPGHDLAVIASFWKDGQRDCEYVLTADLPSLLLSCDLRLKPTALEDLLTFADGTNLVTDLEPLEKLTLIVEGPPPDKVELHRREIPGDEFDLFLQDFKYEDGKLLLTVPIGPPVQDKISPMAEPLAAIRVRGVLVISETRLSPSDKKDRTLEFVARFDAALAAAGQDPACGWFAPRPGGRYPVASLQLLDGKVTKIDPAKVSADRIAEKPFEIEGERLVPRTGWTPHTLITFEDKKTGAMTQAGLWEDDEDTYTTRKVKIDMPSLAPGKYLVGATLEPSGNFPESCRPERTVELEITEAPKTPPPGNGGGTYKIDQKPVPGEGHAVTIEVTICIDCVLVIVPFPLPPLAGWLPFGGGGGAPSSGGGGGGLGPPNGCGGWGGFYGFGGAWGVAFGPIVCFITITAVIHYQDSDFVITATVIAPPGAELGGLSATFNSGSGLSQVSANRMMAAAAGDMPDDPDAFAVEHRFEFRVRGNEEGIQPYTIHVEGMVRGLGEEGEGEPWGPMDIEGQVEIVPPFFLVGLTFTSDYLDDGTPFEMIAAVTNSEQATETAFDTRMAVSGEGADVLDAVKELGDLAPGDTAVADFSLISRHTGPVIGTSHRETGRVAVDVNVAGTASAPPSYPIQGSPGLAQMLARYPELTRAVLALAGSSYAEGLARTDPNLQNAAVAVALSLHRAGFRLLAGEEPAEVIGELLLDVQGGASPNRDLDRLRRTSPPGARVRAAGGRALVQAAGESGVLDSGTLLRRIAEAAPGSPVVLWGASSSAVTLEAVDGEGNGFGGQGLAGERRELPYAELYAEAWPDEPRPLLAIARSPETGELAAVPVIGPVTVDLWAALPAPDGGLVRAVFRGVAIPPGGRAVLDFIGEPAALVSPVLRIGAVEIFPDETAPLADPPPRVLTATIAPARQGGAPYRNVEVRFSEALDLATAEDAARYRIPGYGVLRAAYYRPTRAVFLFLDGPLAGGSTLSIDGVTDLRGQPVSPAPVPIRGGARAGVVQGRILGPDGLPLPEAEVTLSATSLLTGTKADAEGVYRFERVPVGAVQVDALDPATGRAGGASQRLVVDGQDLAVDVRLAGDATVTGRVRAADGTPASGAEVIVVARWPFQASARADAGGYFRVDRVPLGFFSVSAGNGTGASASASGTLTALDEVATRELTLALPPAQPASARGRVLSAAGVGIAGAVVRLEGDAAVIQTTTGVGGAWQIGPFPPGEHTLTAQVADGRTATRTVTINGVAGVDLVLFGTGVVTVRVFGPDGRAVAGARTGLAVGAYSAEGSTDSAGLARFLGVPAGQVTVRAQEGDRFGESRVDLGEARAVEVEVPLVPRGFELPITLRDANGTAWTIAEDGSASTDPAGLRCGRLTINGVPFAGRASASTVTQGLEIGIEQPGVAGVDVSRRIYISPLDGFFVRWVDTVTNPDTPGMTAVEIEIEVGADVPGFAAVGAPAGTAVFQAADGAGLALAFAGRPSGAPLPAGYRYARLMLAPGQSLSILHFASRRPAVHAATTAGVLAAPPPELLAALDAAALRRIVNYDLPEAMGGTSPSNPLVAFGPLEVHALTADGFVIALAEVEAEAHTPLYDRKVAGRADPSGTAVVPSLPAGEVRALVRHPLTGAAGAATATISAGRTTPIDVRLESSGTVEGLAMRADGTPLPQTDVYVQGVRVGTSLAGRYRLRGVPLGDVDVVAVERQEPNLAGRARGSLATTGRTVTIDVSLPPVGTVRGRLLAADGVTPLPGRPVTLAISQPDNRGTRAADTGVDGRFNFPLVPQGEAALTAEDPDTGAVALATTRVDTDGQIVEIDLVLSAVGVVTGRVTAWDGLAPRASARVGLIDAAGASFQSTADSLGRFAFAGAAAGPFTVTARPGSGPGAGPGSGTASGSIAADGARATVEVRLDEQPPAIEIVSPAGVIDALAVPVEIAAADAETGIDPATLTAVLDGLDITARLAPGADGRWRGEIPVGQGARLGDGRIEATISDRAGNTASASSAFRVAAATLALTLRVPNALVRLVDRLGERSFTAGGDGRLDLLIPPGDAVLTISASTADGPAGLYATAMGQDGEVVRLDLTPVPAGFVIARALGRNGVTPLPGVEITLFDSLFDELFDEMDRRLAVRTTDETGAALFEVAPAGLVRVRFTADGETGEASGTLLQGEELTLLAVQGGAGTLAGTVRTAAGDPVAGVDLTLQIGAETRTTASGDGGLFSFAGLPPGQRFRLDARDPATGLGAEAEGIIPAGGSTLRLTLVLEPAGTVSGPVLTFDRRPAAGALVTLRSVSRPDRTGTAGDDGAFSFPFVPAGGFQLTASRPDGDYGQVSGTIAFAGDEETVELLLAGLGMLAVTVLDSDARPVPGARVGATLFDGRVLPATADAEGMIQLSSVLAGFVRIDATDPASGLTVSGSVQVVPGATASATLTLPAVGSISGRVLRADGATPVAGAAVSLLTPGGFYLGAVAAGADGGFRFANLLLSRSPFRVDASLAGRTAGRASDLALTANGEELRRDLVLVPLGTVRGRLLGPDGAPAAGLPLTLTSAAPLGGGSFPAVSGGDGSYLVANVPAGAFQVRAADPARGLAAEVSGAVNSDGEEVALDARLAANTTFLPYTLADLNRFSYVIEGDGRLLAPFTLRSAPLLTITRTNQETGQDTPFTGSGLGLLGAGGRQVTVRQTLGMLDVSRRIHIAAGGFAARYVELLSNSGPEDATVDVALQVRLEPFGQYGRLLATSSGRSIPEAGGADPDRWAVLAAGASGRFLVNALVPYIAVVWDGPGGTRAASEVTVDAGFPGELTVRFRGVAVPAGGQVALLHYFAQSATPEGARAAAERLSLRPPEGLEALAAEELAAVVNWSLPADGRSVQPPLPPVRSRTVRGTCLAGDGQTPVSDGTITVRAADPLFSRAATGNAGAGGAFVLPSVSLPDGPFTATARRTVEEQEVTAAASALAPAGATDLSVDLLYAGTGGIRGTVLDAAGQPVPAFVSGAGQASTDPEGRFLLAGLPAGVYKLTAARGAAMTSVFATVAPDVTVQADLAFPLPGTVAARVVDPDGSPVPGLYLQLSAAEGPSRLGAFTDADGTALFQEVTPGTYIAEAAQPETGQATRERLRIDAGATARPALTLAGTAVVTGTVTLLAGDPLPGLQVILVPEGGTLPGQGGGGGGSLAASAAAPPPPDTGVQPAAQSLYAQTDADGRFRFNAAPIGGFTLVATSDVSRALAFGQTGQPGETVDVDVVFPPLGRVRVTVLQDGQPAAGRYVNLQLAEGRSLSGSTDEAGQFLSPLLPAGEVRVLVYGEATLTATGTLIEDGQILDLVPMASTVGGSLSGTVRITVRTAAGEPPLFPHNVLVRTAPDDVRYASPVADGEFLIDMPLPAPSFRVRAEAGATLFAALDGGIADGDSSASFVLAFPPAGRLEGRVLDADGNPVSVPIGVESSGARQSNAAYSDGSDGRFVLDPLPLGAFTLTAGSPGGPRARIVGELTGDTGTVVLALPRPGVVEVTAPETPFPSGFAYLYPAGQDEAESQALYGPRTGNLYRFDPVPPGLFAVLQPSPPATIGGRVEPGGTVRLSLPADAAPGTVYGEALTADGDPCAGVYLSILTSGPNGPLPQVVATDARGRYLVRGVAAGPVCTIANRGGFGPDAGASGDLPPGGGLRLDLRSGSSTVLPLPGPLGDFQAGRRLALTGGLFQEDFRLRVNGLPYSDLDWARRDLSGQRLEMGPAPAAGVLVERRLYAPEGAGWARYLEILDNPGPDPVELRIEISGTAAGPVTQTQPGRWLVSAAEGRPPLGFVFGGAAGQAPADVSFTEGEEQLRPRRAWRYAWELTLAPGERAAYLHFAIQGDDPGAVAALAAALSGLTAPDAELGIPPEVRSRVRNF